MSSWLKLKYKWENFKCFQMYLLINIKLTLLPLKHLLYYNGIKFSQPEISGQHWSNNLQNPPVLSSLLQMSSWLICTLDKNWDHLR